jgi:Flp pilus assembly protein TadB
MLLSMLVAILVLVSGGSDWVRLRQRRRPVDEVQLLTAIHTELRAGASLRQALASATGSIDGLQSVRGLALSGAPLEDIAANVSHLPTNGSRLASALQVAAQAGGRSADVFARLADRAVEEAALAREKQALTTQVRMSAAVVGGLPLVWFLLGGVGRLSTLAAAGGAGLAIAVAGAAMEIGGVLLVWRLAMA